ncbi:MAG: ATP-dependent helicase [Anaerolinea sp.]|nr:ATP-dependent helicase [Anaerolinea sp.]
MTTPYHAKYFAYELTRQGGAGVERLSRSIFDACVDLNPHQIEAALFAVRSPVSKGVLLADEVGLGKTIEAGLVLCEYWAERKRKLLVITPASIRKQWALELSEKFNLPTVVLDAKAYKEQIATGNPMPFDSTSLVITSLNYASKCAEEIKAIHWDLVVIDEAHKLRNAYRQSNKMGQRIRWAIEDFRKILLTATPLQNSLLELYGLTTLIDDRIFGDLPSFRTQYTNAGGDLNVLRERLKFYSIRTLRRQVLEYVKYTERRLITRPFKPTENEQKLYEAISAFLQRPDTYALPQQQRHLTTLIVRKLLASSPQAVAGTLETMRDRLIDLREKQNGGKSIAEEILTDEEMDDELLDAILSGEDPMEFEPDKSEDESPEEKINSEKKNDAPIDLVKLNSEIQELELFSRWARSIGVDSKIRSLLIALDVGFKKMAEMGAPQKAVLFTESRRTQRYIKDFLDANGYAGKTVIFNGTNNDTEQTMIYERWVEANRENGRATGSKDVNVRTALIEHFQNTASIMIATEAAAEGINLQFCSLVINYDLPWNPQRIEQRIGRCHRYGQKHDVVVINFLNESNAADQRVYELLNEKFNLFNGVFGASDDVLGSIESGMDFERRILDIYQQCRTTKEIELAFNILQRELDQTIQSRLQDTRKILLENFDEDVHSRLKANLMNTRERLDWFSHMFWVVTKFILAEQARFDDRELTFQIPAPGMNEFLPGKYHLISKVEENITGDFLYRLSHPLGEFVLQQAKANDTPTRLVTFDISHNPVKVAMVEALKGKSGWLQLQQLAIDSFEREEYLLFSGFDSAGNSLDQETLEKLFHCKGIITAVTDAGEDARLHLEKETQRHVQAAISRSLEENNRHFTEARDRLEKWADDMILASEKELRDTKQQIKVLNRQSRMATTLEEQHQLQEKIQDLEKKKRRQRQQIFDMEDEIAQKRDDLISTLEKRMTQKTASEPLFTIAWKVV